MEAQVRDLMPVSWDFSLHQITSVCHHAHPIEVMWVLHPLPLLSLVIYDIQRQRGVVCFRPLSEYFWWYSSEKRELKAFLYHAASISYILDDDKRHLYCHKSISLPTSQPIFISCSIDIEVSSIRHLIPFFRSSHPSPSVSYHLK